MRHSNWGGGGGRKPFFFSGGGGGKKKKKRAGGGGGGGGGEGYHLCFRSSTAARNQKIAERTLKIKLLSYVI